MKKRTNETNCVGIFRRPGYFYYYSVMEIKKSKNIEGINVGFYGDAKNNVATSMMIICAKLGVNFVVIALDTGVWISMGELDEIWGRKIKQFKIIKYLTR